MIKNILVNIVGHYIYYFQNKLLQIIIQNIGRNKINWQTRKCMQICSYL